MFLQSIIFVDRDSDMDSIKEEIYKNLEKITAKKPNKNYELEINLDQGKSNIGIENINRVAEWSGLRTEAPRAAFIFNSEKLTVHAQNSLLKILEEPGNLSQIVLVTNNKDSLLETILSRCRILESHSTLDIKIENIKEFLNSKYLHQKNTIYKASENRVDLQEFLDSLLNAFNHETTANMLWNRNKNMIELLEKWQKAVYSNVNTKLIANSILINLRNNE